MITITLSGAQGTGKTLLTDWLRVTLPQGIRPPYKREPIDIGPVTIVDADESFVVPGTDPMLMGPPVDTREDLANRIRATVLELNSLCCEASGLKLRVEVTQLERQSFGDPFPITVLTATVLAKI